MTNRLTSIFLMILIASAIFAAVPATADEPADRLPFAKPGPGSSMVAGALGRPAQYIYPVEFIAIDGRNIHPREVMWLEPGEYELTVRAFVTNAPGLRSGTRFRESDGNNVVRVSVEAGKEYSVGLKYDASEPVQPFSTVVYRVEDN